MLAYDDIIQILIFIFERILQQDDIIQEIYHFWGSCNKMTLHKKFTIFGKSPAIR